MLAINAGGPGFDTRQVQQGIGLVMGSAAGSCTYLPDIFTPEFLYVRHFRLYL